MALPAKDRASKYVNGLNFSSTRRRLKEMLEEDFVSFELIELNGKEYPALILYNSTREDNVNIILMFDKMLDSKLIVFEPRLMKIDGFTVKPA